MRIGHERYMTLHDRQPRRLLRLANGFRIDLTRPRDELVVEGDRHVGTTLAHIPDEDVGVTDELNLFIDLLRARVGPSNVRTDVGVVDDESHDEALGATAVTPLAVVLPECTDQVVQVLRSCSEHGVPLTARGSGSGLSGACIPPNGGVVLSFQRMNKILEIDDETHLAVVQPGVQLDQLDAALAEVGLAYPVYPGEYSATIGGNIATNAGGMQAVKHGVTRHHVLGLELALATGEVIRTGGRVVKASSGYDLTQLVDRFRGHARARDGSDAQTRTPALPSARPCLLRSRRSTRSPPRCRS